MDCEDGGVLILCPGPVQPANPTTRTQIRDRKQHIIVTIRVTIVVFSAIPILITKHLLYIHYFHQDERLSFFLLQPDQFVCLVCLFVCSRVSIVLLLCLFSLITCQITDE